MFLVSIHLKSETVLEPVPSIYTSEVWKCVETCSWYLYIWSLKVCRNTFLISIHLYYWKCVETHSWYLYIWGLKLCWNMFQYIWSLKVCLNTFLISMLQKSETALRCVQLTLCCPVHMNVHMHTCMETFGGGPDKLTWASLPMQQKHWCLPVCCRPTATLPGWQISDVVHFWQHRQIIYQYFCLFSKRTKEKVECSTVKPTPKVVCHLYICILLWCALD